MDALVGDNGAQELVGGRIVVPAGVVALQVRAIPDLELVYTDGSIGAPVVCRRYGLVVGVVHHGVRLEQGLDVMITLGREEQFSQLVTGNEVVQMGPNPIYLKFL